MPTKKARPRPYDKCHKEAAKEIIGKLEAYKLPTNIRQSYSMAQRDLARLATLLANWERSGYVLAKKEVESAMTPVLGVESSDYWNALDALG